MMNPFEPKIIVFCCHNCIPPQAAEIERQQGANIKLVKLPCSGRIEVLYLLKAFESGADGVLVAGCLDGNCQSLDGNLRAKTRVAQAKKYLDEIGLGQERLQMKQLDSSRKQAEVAPLALAESVAEMIEKLKELG